MRTNIEDNIEDHKHTELNGVICPQTIAYHIRAKILLPFDLKREKILFLEFQKTRQLISVNFDMFHVHFFFVIVMKLSGLMKR